MLHIKDYATDICKYVSLALYGIKISFFTIQNGLPNHYFLYLTLL